MASISPSGVNSASYTPTNSPTSCPPIQAGTWMAKATPLPPAVNPSLCSCMYNSLGCVVKGTTDEKAYGELFNQVCSYGQSCAGIAANASTGTYGAYGTCNSTEQLGFAFNQYYQSQNKAGTACDFGGAATTKSPGSSSGSCSALLQQAGSAGTGTVTSGASSTSTKKSAAGAVVVPRVETGVFSVGIYAVVAGFFGAGMILL